jgi:hypothetical protein
VVERKRKLAVVGWIGDAEASASSDASASCYRIKEDVRLLAIVETPRKLVEIQRQISLGDVVIRADHAALQQGPERFEIVGMHFAAHVFVGLVIEVLVRKCLVKLPTTSGLIGRDQADFIGYNVTNKLTHHFSGCIFDDFCKLHCLSEK